VCLATRTDGRLGRRPPVRLAGPLDPWHAYSTVHSNRAMTRVGQSSRLDERVARQKAPGSGPTRRCGPPSTRCTKRRGRRKRVERPSRHRAMGALSAEPSPCATWRRRREGAHWRTLGELRPFLAYGAAQESNLPSVGLRRRTGFEDQLGHRPRPLRAQSNYGRSAGNALATAALRVCTPSFSRMFSMCFRTVCGDTTSIIAIPLVVFPPAM
jgi:hypothetical protein